MRFDFVSLSLDFNQIGLNLWHNWLVDEKYDNCSSTWKFQINAFNNGLAIESSIVVWSVYYDVSCLEILDESLGNFLFIPQHISSH